MEELEFEINKTRKPNINRCEWALKNKLCGKKIGLHAKSQWLCNFHYDLLLKKNTRLKHNALSDQTKKELEELKN